MSDVTVSYYRCEMCGLTFSQIQAPDAHCPKCGTLRVIEKQTTVVSAEVAAALTDKGDARDA